jgi:hypothetical protein
MMKFLLLLVVVLCVSCAGTGKQYKVTLRNNMEIVASSKPKLDKETGTYKFKDAQGRPLAIPAQHIREIEIR